MGPEPTGVIAVTNVIPSDPQFIDRASGNYHLKVTSPCANAGVVREWMTSAVDLDGRRRVDKFSGKVDMGCYEYPFHGTMFSSR